MAAPWLFGLLAATAAMDSPPQPPLAGDCLWGPFMVFFDLDDDEITPGAAAILDNVASAFPICGLGGPILVEGHSDRSGPAAYNASLARRRAESVRAYLSARGIAARDVVIDSFGESRPLIVTPDAARKPENRRVEVKFERAPGGW
jgi:OmpA-OmpF porin, OOP family